METNDANKGQNKLYLLLRFIGHATFYVRTGLKTLLFKAEIWYVLALWTSVVKLGQLPCLMNAYCSYLFLYATSYTHANCGHIHFTEILCNLSFYSLLVT